MRTRLRVPPEFAWDGRLRQLYWEGYNAGLNDIRKVNRHIRTELGMKSHARGVYEGKMERQRLQNAETETAKTEISDR